MIDFFRRLFDTSDFPARWNCGDWTTGHGVLHIASDLSIFGAYFAIPASIAYYVWQRDDLHFPKLYWLFALFIASCGIGHLVEASIFWQPWYRLSGFVKAITAAASWATVLGLIRYLPQAIRLPGALKLNDELNREVAQRRMAEEKVRDLNAALTQRVQELEALLEMLPVGVGIASDPDCHTIRINAQFRSLLRMAPGSNASLTAPAGEAPTHFRGFHAGRPLDPRQLPLQTAARGEVIRDFELELVFDDGARVHLLSYAQPLQDDHGKLRGAIGAFVDVTGIREAEQARRKMERRLLETQKLESLGLLAGGVAHDFNNLLTGILGSVSLARMELPELSAAHDSLHHIEQTSLRAADLCRQMLAYSGRGKLEVRRASLTQLVQDTTYLLQSSIGRGCTLRYQLTEDLPMVEVDLTQMRQIVMNLVINASEAIGNAPGTITLGTGRVQVDRNYLSETNFGRDLPEGDYVFLEVSDTGCGMSRETMAQIFDPFFTTKFTGRGLGLAAVQGIVWGHRGALKVYSELGRGTTFKILLPAVPGPADVAEPSPPTGTWNGSGTLLVVDDEESVRRVTQRILQSFGFEVLTAVDGASGVELFRQNPGRIAVVLLDLTMPGMGGEEAFREIRRMDPEARVILMSGYNEQEAAARFVGKGLSKFMQKPFHLEALRSALRELLG